MGRITCQDLQSHTAPKVIQVFVGLPVSYSDSLLLWFAILGIHAHMSRGMKLVSYDMDWFGRTPPAEHAM